MQFEWKCMRWVCTQIFDIAVKIAMHSGPGSLHDISVQFTHFHNRSVE